MKKGSAERRKYLRLKAPVGLRIITEDGHIEKPKVKNVSPLGLRFEITRDLEEGKNIELALQLSEAKNPIHIQAKVVWRKKTSLEDNAPFDVGCEFVKIEEDNKNTFLKYFCDLIYEEGEGSK